MQRGKVGRHRANYFFGRLIYFLIILSCNSCYNYENKTGAPGFNDLDKAAWIGDAKILPDADSLFYKDDPAPMFRKEFISEGELKSAVLYITAAGYYSASINGERIGTNYIDPAWTDYSKRIYYSEYDITANIETGTNCLGVTLGNGFYNPLPMRMWGKYNLRESLPVGRPVFISRLRLEYIDGKTEEYCSDNTWKYAYGPLLKNNIFIGEFYDAEREINGWNKPGFDDADWENAPNRNGPGGKLQKIFFPPVQVTEIISPVKVSSPKEDVYIVDMGVNFTGLYRINLRGNSGDTITLRFGERLYENGMLNPMTTVAGQIKREGMAGAGAPSLACQTDSYVFGESREAWYSPEFTFHIYRYMEITGLKYSPVNTDIKGIAFNSNVGNKNSFFCSSDLVNSIQQATRRTFSNNLISVQSDCPGRERFAYGGDLNAVCESFIYNYDMHHFYRKTVYDWVDALNDSVFLDTAPYVGINYCGLSWESAFLMTQYKLLLFYNDVEIVKELYKLDLKWMEKVARLYPSGVVDKGLSDHESIENVPVELIQTTHYLECMRIMKTFSRLMNDRKNEKKFTRSADELRELLLDMFWKKTVSGPINRQTLFSTLLYYDIIPDSEIPAATDSLLKALAEGPSRHFSTGIFGTGYILEALSKTGHSDNVFSVVNSTSYPGWGFMIDRGATTIWETWKESDNIYSNCHPMFGSVSGWFYRCLAGIRPDPDHPGFERFVIAPSLPPGLDYVKCVYQSPFGEIVSNWSKSGINTQLFEIKIPEGSVATVKLPVNKQQQIIIRKTDGNSFISEKNTEIVLNNGEYTILVTPE